MRFGPPPKGPKEFHFQWNSLPEKSEKNILEEVELDTNPYRH